jgi:hypothetical protein
LDGARVGGGDRRGRHGLASGDVRVVVTTMRSSRLGRRPAWETLPPNEQRESAGVCALLQTRVFLPGVRDSCKPTRCRWRTSVKNSAALMLR